jgi:DNA-binding MarR family transcriptional regulator
VIRRAITGADTDGVEPDSVRDVLLAAERLHRTLRQALEDVLEGDRLNVAQWLILSEIGSRRGGTLTDFARITGRDAGSLSRAVYQLSQRGWLTNRRSKLDRRSADLDLTVDGQLAYDRLAGRIDRLAGVLAHSTDLSGPERISPMLDEVATRIERCRRDRVGP